MKSDNESKLAEIFRVVLEMDIGADVSALRRIGAPAWDSLAHATLVAAIESEFGVRINVADVEDRMGSFAAVRLLLEDMGK